MCGVNPVPDHGDLQRDHCMLSTSCYGITHVPSDAWQSFFFILHNTPLLTLDLGSVNNKNCQTTELPLGSQDIFLGMQFICFSQKWRGSVVRVQDSYWCRSVTLSKHWWYTQSYQFIRYTCQYNRPAINPHLKDAFIVVISTKMENSDIIHYRYYLYQCGMAIMCYK